MIKSLFAQAFRIAPVFSRGDFMFLGDQKEIPEPESSDPQIRRLKDEKRLFTMDFQNGGEFAGGCIAGGRNCFHINANGDAEPCVFIHYSNANIRTHAPDDTCGADTLTKDREASRRLCEKGYADGGDFLPNCAVLP